MAVSGAWCRDNTIPVRLASRHTWKLTCRNCLMPDWTFLTPKCGLRSTISCDSFCSFRPLPIAKPQIGPHYFCEHVQAVANTDWGLEKVLSSEYLMRCRFRLRGLS